MYSGKEVPVILETIQPHVLVDSTNSPEISMHLSLAAKEKRVIHLILEESHFNLANNWTFPGRIRLHDFIDATISVLEFYSWNTFSVSSEISTKGLEFSSKISEASASHKLNISTRYFVPDILGPNINAAGRLIKPTGTRIHLIYADNTTNTKAFLKALYRKNIGGAGFGVFGVGEGWLYLYSLV
jgi:hypothetical protein